MLRTADDRGRVDWLVEDEFKKRRDEEYIPQKVKDWWNSLDYRQKEYWIKRAETERKNLVGRSK